jgi:hypothetical protein
MAHRQDMHPQHFGLVGLAVLAVLLFIVALVWSSWRAGLLTVRPEDFAMRLPATPILPRTPMPNPQPPPLPRPGPGVSA